MPETLVDNLFSDDGKHSYAIVDGASCEELADKLAEHAPPSVCLFAGELEPDVEEVAPHLVRLSANDVFTDWLLGSGAGQHWGIYARSPDDLLAMRKHFRTFLMVRDPDREPVYFRYYDPRVLTLYLPTCDPSELRTVFGSVTTYFSENDADAATAWWLEDGALSSKKIALHA